MQVEGSHILNIIQTSVTNCRKYRLRFFRRPLSMKEDANYINIEEEIALPMDAIM